MDFYSRFYLIDYYYNGRISWISCQRESEQGGRKQNCIIILKKLRYAVSGMQGWRKRMEDAFIAEINVGPEKNINIFGIFDGHGGTI